MTAASPASPLSPASPPEARPLPPARPGPAGTSRIEAVRYAGIPGYRPLELDVYLPAQAPAPAVLFFHGGGWRIGSRDAVGPAFAGASPTPFERIAAAGIAVISADYRLSAEAPWPAQLDDVRAALTWVRKRAEELGIDPGRIALWGESAGAHLAAHLGLAAEPPVRAVVAWYPPTDLISLPADNAADPDDPDSREAQLLGAPISANTGRAADASPVSHVKPGAPPFLLLHGRADRFVSFHQSERLAEALDAAGTDVTLHLFDDADHMWLGTPDTAEAALEETLAYLTARLET